MKPSKYQQGVLDWLANGKGNATCNAVAGSGKTTTLKLAAQQLRSMGLEPRDIKVIVFGKQNSLDLIAKFGREWKFSIQTLHSVGFRVLQQEIGKFRRDERVVSSKYRRIAEQKKLIPRKTKKRTYKGSLTESNAISRVEHFLTLIDLARLTLSDLSVESIKGIAYHHNLEGIHDFKRVSRAIANILIEGQEQAINEHRIDFTDMVWLPVEWALNQKSWFRTYQFVLVDECLPGDSLITLDDGSQIPIKTIVENRLPVSVLSYNELTQKIEAKTVVGWHKVPLRNREILKLGHLRATEDHPVFTQEYGYVPMATAVAENLHLLALNHEELRSQHQANQQREIDYHRVAAWRCFNRQGQVEGKTGQCQSTFCSRSSTATVSQVETGRVTALDWDTSFRETNSNRIWWNDLLSQYSDSSSIHGNLGTNQAQWQEKTNYCRASTDVRQFGDCCLVYGRWDDVRVQFENSDLCFSPTGFGIGLQSFNWLENFQQDIKYVQRSGYYDRCQGNSKIKGNNCSSHSSCNELQARQDHNSSMCFLPSILSDNEIQKNLQSQVRIKSSESKSQKDNPTETTICSLSDLCFLFPACSSWQTNYEDLQLPLLPTTSDTDTQSQTENESEQWVYCLDVEDNHNFFADGILVHNCQDLNAAQLELSLMLAGNKGRILAVGDPKQAIYGFGGADNRSYQKIVERTQASELPLSLCYRCPKSHIDLVNRIYPEIPIEPSPNAETGTLECIDKSNLWDEAHPGRLVVGDMVLSRKTAPLVSLCIRLIGQGIAATVKGKDIGKQIKSELEAIADIKGFQYKEFNLFVQQYRDFKFQTYENLDNAEQLKENLADKLNALSTIYRSQPNATCIAHLGDYIDDLFSDDESPITLATVHRAKGLEGDRIFIIKPEDMPMSWERQLQWQKEQEDNLLYVALTRSKSTLYIVGKPDWFKDEEEKETSATERATSNDNTDEDSDELSVGYAESNSACRTTLLATSTETSPTELETLTLSSTVNGLHLLDDNESIDVPGVMLLIAKLFSYEEKCELLTLLTDEVTQEKWDRVFNCLLKDANRSDRAIATECKVSAPFVGKVRKNMIERREIEPEIKRVDRRGRKQKSPIN